MLRPALFQFPLRPSIQRLLLAATLLLLLLTATSSRAAYNVWTNQYTVSQQDLQTALSKQFPRKLRYMELFEINLSNPRLTLNPASNRLVTTVDASIANPLLLPQPLSGSLSLSSALKYDSKEHAVKLDAPAVERIDFAGVPAQYGPQLNAIGNAAAQQILANYAIYRFQPEQLEWNGKTVEPGAITVQADGIAVEIKQ